MRKSQRWLEKVLGFIANCFNWNRICLQDCCSCNSPIDANLVGAAGVFNALFAFYRDGRSQSFKKELKNVKSVRARWWVVELDDRV